MQDKDIIARPKIFYDYESIFIPIFSNKYIPINLVNRVRY